MIKRMASALTLAAVMTFSGFSVSAASISSSGTTTIYPNRLTITWADGSRTSTTIDSFRFNGYNVAQLRTMVSVLGGTVLLLQDGSYQISFSDTPVPYSDIGFKVQTDVKYIINHTRIRDTNSNLFYPHEPGWVYLNDYAYNWASIRDLISVMGYNLDSYVDNPEKGSTNVVISKPSDPKDWLPPKPPGNSGFMPYWPSKPDTDQTDDKETLKVEAYGLADVYYDGEVHGDNFSKDAPGNNDYRIAAGETIKLSVDVDPAGVYIYKWYYADVTAEEDADAWDWNAIQGIKAKSLDEVLAESLNGKCEYNDPAYPVQSDGSVEWVPKNADSQPFKSGSDVGRVVLFWCEVTNADSNTVISNFIAVQVKAAKVNTWTVTYDVNCNDCSFLPGLSNTVNVDTGLAVPVPPGLSTRIWYILTGWNTEPDGSGKNWDFDIDIMPDHDLILWAQWESLVFKCDYGVSAPDNPVASNGGLIENYDFISNPNAGGPYIVPKSGLYPPMPQNGITISTTATFDKVPSSVFEIAATFTDGNGKSLAEIFIIRNTGSEDEMSVSVNQDPDTHLLSTGIPYTFKMKLYPDAFGNLCASLTIIGADADYAWVFEGASNWISLDTIASDTEISLKDVTLGSIWFPIFSIGDSFKVESVSITAN